ncbi:hypothetical protein [Candidatus Regiella insecticola]|uniref:hypothetical protein n=1 Tax=Candidatus Regiella insecticola TaxID=138073 RepID=UPI001C3F3C08|nr:hypothetical protein [Candidatus Regiella insecticola]
MANFSSNGRDFEFIRDQRRKGVDIHTAVYALAQRNFPEEMEALELWSTIA